MARQATPTVGRLDNIIKDLERLHNDAHDIIDAHVELGALSSAGDTVWRSEEPRDRPTRRQFAELHQRAQDRPPEDNRQSCWVTAIHLHNNRGRWPLFYLGGDND